jgi:hypothetical protein
VTFSGAPPARNWNVVIAQVRRPNMVTFQQIIELSENSNSDSDTHSDEDSEEDSEED